MKLSNISFNYDAMSEKRSASVEERTDRPKFGGTREKRFLNLTLSRLHHLDGNASEADVSNSGVEDVRAC